MSFGAVTSTVCNEVLGTTGAVTTGGVTTLFTPVSFGAVTSTVCNEVLGTTGAVTTGGVTTLFTPVSFGAVTSTVCNEVLGGTDGLIEVTGEVGATGVAAPVTLTVLRLLLVSPPFIISSILANVEEERSGN